MHLHPTSKKANISMLTLLHPSFLFFLWLFWCDFRDVVFKVNSKNPKYFGSPTLTLTLFANLNLLISHVIGNNNALYIVVYDNAIPVLIIHVRYVENVS